MSKKWENIIKIVSNLVVISIFSIFFIFLIAGYKIGFINMMKVIAP